MKPRIERRAANVAGDWPDAIHPVLRRVYAARGIASPSEIEHRLTALLAPHSLGGLERACELIEAALRRDVRIMIVGDFDADGATGTAVAMRGLRLLGARNVDYAVPNRFRHGYGLSPALVEELRARTPELLITVDNGVAANAGVAAAKALGMQVIVTDHHLPGAVLPPADAIVNPNCCSFEECGHGRPPCDLCVQDARMNTNFASKALAGVGVMFYLLLALRARLRERGWFAERGVNEPDLAVLLDLVALGTVADLVRLDRNNRILVEAGLRRIRSGRACAGIVALLASGKRDPARAVASDLAFVVGPRINAAGRLEDMRLGIECLLADDAARAVNLAETLAAINAERRELQAGMVEQAQAEVDKWKNAHGAEALPRGLVLFDPGWHHGVVGLVASKLKETLNRPVIACAPSSEGADEIKASGRSIEGFHLRDALAQIDAAQPGLLARFGGHAMAAGLSMQRADLPAFSLAFDAVARERIAPEQLESVLLSDGELGAADFSFELARQLRAGGPWGQAFPEPLFDGEFAVESWRVVGERHWRLKLRLAGLSTPLDAVLFNAPLDAEPPARVRAAYQFELDEWQGILRLQLLLRHMEQAGR
jgi:single-stranded-DNA-specific exonuclease